MSLVTSYPQQPCSPTARLPYLRKRFIPSSYHEALNQAVESFKEIKSKVDWVFDIAGYQPSIHPYHLKNNAHEENLKSKRRLYQWETCGNFPPHLKNLPVPDRAEQLFIFDFKRMYDTLQAAFPLVPDVDFFQHLAPSDGSASMKYLENRNHFLHNWTSHNMYAAENIGLREDWYSDAVFAQQQFTGVNPTTITRASPEWTEAFLQAAIDQGNVAVGRQIRECPLSSLYMQDNSNLRTAAGKGPAEEITSTYGNLTGTHPRYGCASIVLFQLFPSGKLHPLAIILDYKGSIDASTSVTIFNRRLRPEDLSTDQKSDWPWRYAKMCAQVSDYTVHEFVVHLVNTHLVEEAIIVGAQRNFPDSHILITLLKPHWNTTLSLNALARELMVPQMIAKNTGFKLPELYEVCRNAYKSFDFTGSYVPADLDRRGFPISQLEDASGPFHNYAYARNIIRIWDVLHRFVGSVLSTHYPNGDADVAADEYVSSFCSEMQSCDGGGLSSFPTITTLASLVDMVTMCIHIAAPQHSAVNYLQQYYLTFIPNKPAALYAPLPASLDELQGFGEADVLKALPLKLHSAWLLMAQIPYLLSAEVESEDSILTYAENVSSSEDTILANAGKVLCADLAALSKEFKEHSRQLDDQTKKYDVLDPVALASSIII